MKKITDIASLIWIFDIEEGEDTVTISYFMGRKETPLHLILDRGTGYLGLPLLGKLDQRQAFNIVESHEMNKVMNVTQFDVGALQTDLKNWMDCKN